MEKIKNALKSVNKFGLLALVLVAFATLAFKAPTKRVDVLWGNNSGTWVQLTPTSEYTCDGDQDVCTRTYPAGKNPTDNPSDYTSQIPGEFIQ